MSYVLIEGKRYYKDDITGRISLDTASNEEAERRAQRNRVCSSQVGNGSNYGRKQVILTIFIIALLSGNMALLYNHYHVSKAQNTISQYMDSKDNEKRSHENRELSSETMNSNEYIMPDSTSRYLELTDGRIWIMIQFRWLFMRYMLVTDMNLLCKRIKSISVERAGIVQYQGKRTKKLERNLMITKEQM
mgnify:CR=1 FL=1